MIAVIVTIAVLWVGAAAAWLADGTSARQTVDAILLSEGSKASAPAAREEAFVA